MAGDFIKLEKATLDKPEVLSIAARMESSVAESFYLCVKFWCWADSQSRNGHISVTDKLLDSLVGRIGFASALLSVDWLRVRSDGSLEVPHWDRHLSESAKKRADSCKRQQKSRHKTVTEPCDKSVTREEKRREEKSKKENKDAAASEVADIPSELDTTQFRHAWSEWAAYRSEIKKKWTAASQRQQLVKLAPMGAERATSAIYHSIANGWQGIFESKGTGNGNSSSDPRGNFAAAEEAKRRWGTPDE